MIERKKQKDQSCKTNSLVIRVSDTDNQYYGVEEVNGEIVGKKFP